jgi:orotidine-5'-phosphate decarboxylase
MDYNPIIVPLDVPTRDAALALTEKLAGSVGVFKIGKELFVSEGPSIVREIRATGADIFLDLKFHDIPNTVAGAVRAATRLGVQMVTIHTCGGTNMMVAAEVAAQQEATSLEQPTPLVLGVTVLTSMDAEDINEVGTAGEVAPQVERLATLAAASGLRGLVCSPLEIEMLRAVLPAEVKLVTPGIRPATSETQDQKRVMTPAQAMKAGADWLVIGRPITQANDPAAAAKAILDSI